MAARVAPLDTTVLALDGTWSEQGNELVFAGLGHLKTSEVGDVLERAVRRIERHLSRDGDARILMLPADHHVDSEEVLRRALLDAAHAVRDPGAPLLLLGMAADDGDNEYGFILPAARPPRDFRPVQSFVEKPPSEKSRALVNRGALVNSFIITVRGTTLVELCEDALPELVRSFVPVVLAGSPRARPRQLYDEIPNHDFSKAVIEPHASSLSVLPVPPCGWSDLGTPSRLELFLEHRPMEHSSTAVAV